MSLVDVVSGGTQDGGLEWEGTQKIAISSMFRVIGIGDGSIWGTSSSQIQASPEVFCIPKELRGIVRELKAQDDVTNWKRYRNLFSKYSHVEGYPDDGSDLGDYFLFFRNLHHETKQNRKENGGDGSYELQLIIHYLVTGTGERENPQWTVSSWTRGSSQKYAKIDKMVIEDVKSRRRMVRVGPTGKLDVKYSNYIDRKVIRESCHERGGRDDRPRRQRPYYYQPSSKGASGPTTQIKKRTKK